MPPDETIQAFISYAHADADDVQRLWVHLRSIEAHLPVRLWRDREGLLTGDSLSGKIAAAISESHVFVLAVTPDFFDSDYIFKHELPAILARVKAVTGLILVVVVKRCRWESFVGKADLVAAPLTEAGQLMPARDWTNEHGFDAAAEQCEKAIQARYRLGSISVLSRWQQEQGGLAFEAQAAPNQNEPSYFGQAVQASDEDSKAADQPETRQRQAEAGLKAEALLSRIDRLHNDLVWAGLAVAAKRATGLLKLEPVALAAQAFPLWALSQTLATYAAQDDRLSALAKHERNSEPLAPEQRRALDDLLTTLPPFVRRFPSVLADDDRLRQEAGRPGDRRDADAVLQQAEQGRVLSPDADAAVKALRTSPREGGESPARDRLDRIVIRTARNLGGAIAGFVAGALARAIDRRARGESAPQPTELERRAQEVLEQARAPLGGLYRDIPDMERAIDVVARRSAARDDTAVPPADRAPPSPVSPPAELDKAIVRQMILRGEAPPQEWVRFIDELDLSRSPLDSLVLIASLTQLQYLDLKSTQVTDLAPIRGLTQLQSLYLDSTQAADLAPISGLTQLQSLYLNATPVADLAPIADLARLKNLSLDYTLIADLAHIARLTQLQYLSLEYTQIADLAPIDGLTRLQSLLLNSTQVADLAPIAGLAQLQSLDLSSTQVADLARIDSLTQLQYLLLNATRVADLAPIAGLTQLQSLYLNSSQVTDLSPLAGLAQLQSLNLVSTPVADLSPLAGLSGLRVIRLADRSRASRLARSLPSGWSTDHDGDLQRMEPPS